MSRLPDTSNPSYMNRMNRRKFLKLSTGGLVAIVGAGFLNACGRAPTAAPTAPPPTMPQPTAVPPTAAPQATATTAPAVVPALAIGGTMDFLSWEGYDLPTCMKDWETANKVTLSSSYIGDQSEVQAKLTTGAAKGIDLVSYYHGAAATYIDELHILQAIDTGEVPHLKDIYPFFQNGKYWLRNGKTWGIPFTWGAEGLCYNSDKMGPIESYQDLLKPDYKDKIGLVDDWYGMILVGGIAIGLADKMPNLSQAELGQVKAWLIQLKKQARGIAASYGDQSTMLISGEATVAFPGWAALNVWAAASKVNVKMNVPKEGGFAFTDAYAIPVGADNADTALAYINEALSPQVQACQAAALAAGVVNPKALPLLDKVSAEMYDYAHLDDYFGKARFYEYPPNKSDQYATFEQWNNLWLEVKAA
jgi:spermidine/putrescine transport system substrate-binding protein